MSTISEQIPASASLIPPVELNLDIWRLIIDLLGDRSNASTDSLKNLSLTCKTMVPLCRAHLFSAITLIEVDETAIIRFHDLITTTPAITQYIRFFQHSIHFPDDVRIHQIVDILSRSSTLKSIRLRSTGRQWDTFPREFQIPLGRLLQLPSLVTLQLSSIRHVPWSVFSSSIEHLTLQDVDFSMPDEVTSHQMSPCTPDFLSADRKSCDGLLSLAQQHGRFGDKPPVDLSRLDEIQLFVEGPEDIASMCKVLELSAVIQLLDVIKYDPIPWAGLGASLSASASTARTLQTLNLSIMVESSDDDPLYGLVSELSMIAGTNVLETISLEITFNTDTECRADTRDWTAFDSLLTTQGSFPRLKVVGVDIIWVIFFGDGEEALSRISSQTFPRLSESQTLELRFSATVQMI